MEVKVQIRKVSGSPIEELSVISFSFKKNLYQPYTMLNVVFMAENNDYMSVNEVLLYIDGKLIHHGIVDTFEVFDKNGVKTGKVTSRGFTSLLMQNQIWTAIMILIISHTRIIPIPKIIYMFRKIQLCGTV